MKNIQHFTNDLDFYQDIGLDKGIFGFWTLSRMDKTNDVDNFVKYISEPSRFDKVFLLSFDGDLMTLKDKLPNNVYCWDSVIYDDIVQRHYTYLFWAEFLVTVNRQIDSLGKLVNPLRMAPAKTFDCLLGLKRPHRDFIAERVNLSDLKNKFIFNYFGNNQFWIPGGDQDSSAEISVCYNCHDSEEFPVKLEHCNNSQYFIKYHDNRRTTLSLLMPWKIYNDSWFSLVADTRYNYDPNKCFPEVNEKVFKPMLAKRLFVYFGPPLTLKRLKAQGFQTFNLVLDESYDECLDDYQRWTMAWHQIEFLASQNPTQVYKKISPVLEHNQQLLLQTNFRQKFIDEIRSIAGV